MSDKNAVWIRLKRSSGRPPRRTRRGRRVRATGNAPVTRSTKPTDQRRHGGTGAIGG